VFVFYVEPERIIDAHVPVGDPDEAEEGGEVAAPILVRRLVGGWMSIKKSCSRNLRSATGTVEITVRAAIVRGSRARIRRLVVRKP